MAPTSPVEPVKLFVAILWNDPRALEAATDLLRRTWGEIDYHGPDRAFDVTDYYEPEMGAGLKRRIVSFARLVPSEHLREAKLTANRLEEELAAAVNDVFAAHDVDVAKQNNDDANRKIDAASQKIDAIAGVLDARGDGAANGPTARARTVNLDVGYLDHNKLVLGSAKAAGQKIHLGDGIYADLVGRWSAGRYAPFEWTFMDFKDGRYDHELAEIRGIYLAQRRAK